MSFNAAGAKVPYVSKVTAVSLDTYQHSKEGGDLRGETSPVDRLLLCRTFHISSLQDVPHWVGRTHPWRSIHAHGFHRRIHRHRADGATVAATFKMTAVVFDVGFGKS